MLKKSYTTHKTTHIKFIKTISLFMIELPLALLMVFLNNFILKYWPEIPIALKIIWFPIFILTLYGIFIIPFSGLWLLKNKIIFISDVRINIYKKDSIDKITLVFYENNKNCFFASINIESKNGKRVARNYFYLAAITGQKKLANKLYSIKEKNVNKTIDVIKTNPFFEYTIVYCSKNNE